MIECPIISKVVKIQAIEPNLYLFLRLTGLHLDDPLLALAEEKTTSMQSLATKNKRTLQMLSRYDQSLYF